uniref:Ig-like domain-containing protein n=1 Tax=Rattus norvegicus TaxID=10116 RepID=A0ABK0M035_RAT
RTVMIQSPKSMSTLGGDSVTMSCTGSQNMGSYISWNQQKPGQSPKLLISWAFNWYTGVRGYFIGSVSGITISSAQAKDLAVYYCKQHYDTPLIVLQPPTQTSLRASPDACSTHSPGLHTAHFCLGAAMPV